MRTVLHLRATRGWAGPERHLWELASGLNHHGFRLLPVLLSRERTPDQRNLVRLGELDPVVIRDSPGKGRRLRRELDTLVKKRQPVILHSHGYKANRLALSCTKGRELPVVATHHLHTGTTLRLLLHGFWDRFQLRKFNAVMTVRVSDPVDPALALVPRQRLHRIPNGIQVDRFLEDLNPSADIRQELAIPSHHRLILSLGRLSTQKGLSTLFQAVSTLRELPQSWSLILVGEGPERSRLERQKRKLGLESCVHFLGHREDVADLLRAADLVVLPSLREALPYAALEAMAVGKAIIATSVGGLPELLDGGLCGRLTPPGQAPELALAIQGLLQSPGECQLLGQRALTRVREHYPASAMARQVAGVYQDLLGSV